MQTCRECGFPVEFRVIEGRCIPLHTSGCCTAAGSGADETRVRRSVDSECRNTSCPFCKQPVYFIRHNGGSVWIEPPLGPPWECHPCFESERRTAKADNIVSSELLAQVGMIDELITGVVSVCDVGLDRSQTLIEVLVGKDTTVKLLVKGGADSLVGQLVIVAADDRLIYQASDVRLCFDVAATVAGPPELVGKGKILRSPMSNDELEKLRVTLKHGPLSKRQHSMLRKHRQQGLSGDWKPAELLAIIPFLAGKEKDRAVHAAAVLIIESAEAHGDCSGAVSLTQLVAPGRRKRLIAWFREYSPISIDLTRKQRKAYILRTSAGVHRPFRPNVARTTPI